MLASEAAGNWLTATAQINIAENVLFSFFRFMFIMIVFL